MRDKDVWNGLKAPACAAVAAVLLAACGGGGGEGDGSGGGGTPPPPTPGTNGLNYGASGQSLSDVEGETMQLTTSGYRVGSGTFTTANQTVQLNAGSLAGAINGTIQIDGENVVITDGNGTVPGGPSVFVNYDPDLSGTYAGALEITVVDGATVIGENTIVFGFESNPTEIAGRTTGTLTYVGDFQAFGHFDGTPQTEFAGAMTLVADFSGSGTVNGSLNGQVNGAVDVNMDINSAPISGNEFSPTLDCTTCGTMNNGQIIGNFYGPNADEVGGVMTFDFTVSGDPFIGSGSFVLTDPS